MCITSSQQIANAKKTCHFSFSNEELADLRVYFHVPNGCTFYIFCGSFPNFNAYLARRRKVTMTLQAQLNI